MKKYAYIVLISLSLTSCYSVTEFYADESSYEKVMEAKKAVRDSTLIIIEKNVEWGSLMLYNTETETITEFVTWEKYMANLYIVAIAAYLFCLLLLMLTST